MNVSKASCTLAAIGLCVAGFGVGVSMGLRELPEVIGVFVATVIAAFAGTGAAFLFQNQREDRLAKESDLKAAHSIENYLFLQHNHLKIIKREYLDPLKEDPLRSVKLKKLFPTDLDRKLTDVSTLRIFTHSEWSEIPKQVLMIEENFCKCVGIIDERSRIVGVEQVFHTATGVEQLHSTELEYKTFLETFALSTVDKLKNYTDEVYNGNEKISLQYHGLRSHVFLALTKMYPEHKFINPEDDESWSL